jgi:CRISPR-associated protein Csd1
MILQSLTSLYDRLVEDPANGLPMAGYSLQNITFRIIIRSDGTLVEIQDARQEEILIGKNGKEKKMLRPVTLIVPGQTKSTGQGINPCTLWDNLTYLCGYPQPDKDTVKAEKNRVRAPRCFAGSQKHHISTFSDTNDSSILAVRKYFEHYQPADIAPSIESLPIDARLGNGVFQVTGHTAYAHKFYEPIIVVKSSAGNPILGQCLVTGKVSPIARLHEPKIKNFDPKGSLLVSFNEQAYESFAKEDAKKVGQGANSPISEEATFAYCNALNWLLANRERRFRLGDATTVFWTDAPTPAEQLMPWMISGNTPQDPTTLARIQNILQRLASGTIGTDELGDPETPYYILGLSPNASRLSIRFWNTSTLGDLLVNLKKHFEDLRIVRQWDETNSKNPDPLAPTVFQLLRQTSRDADGIPPLLGGALIRAILFGTRYPESLITGVMNRIRVVEKKQQGEGTLDNVSHLRASILKAWLIRNHQLHITEMLEETNTNPGYRLGRLFAVLEKTQQDAMPGINSTIRDRFYSSASATPRSVFGRLLRTYQHHLGKLDIGAKITHEKRAQEILAEVTDFPAHLNLKDQAQFALGYYHQRKALYPSKPKAEGNIGDLPPSVLPEN